MVSSRSSKNKKFNRVLSLALCVGVAFLLLAGSAFAGTTKIDAANQAVTYALQVGKVPNAFAIPAIAPQTYYVPANLGTITREMSVARQQVSGNFLLDVKLASPLVWAAAPDASVITLSVAGGGAIAPSLFNPSTVVGSDTATFLITVTDSFETAPTLSIAMGSYVAGPPVVDKRWQFTDTTGAMAGQNSATFAITALTRDSDTGDAFDSGGTNTVNVFSTMNALSASIVPTSAVVDVKQPSARKLLLATGGDNVQEDNGATVAIKWTVPGVTIYGAAGAVYAPAAADKFRLTFAGAAAQGLNGLTSFVYAPGDAAAITDNVLYGPPPVGTANEVALNSTTLDILGNNAALLAAAGGSVNLRINLDNTTVKATRSITIKIDTILTGSGRTTSDRNLVAATEISRWTFNGTVLVANWANADNTAWKSRFYLWNPPSSGSVDAAVTVRVYQLLVPGATVPVQVGQTYTLPYTLAPGAGVTIRLYEDVISKMSPVPSTADLKGPDLSGNVVVEITVVADGVTGWSQTFNVAGTLFTGTSPLVRIP